MLDETVDSFDEIVGDNEFLFFSIMVIVYVVTVFNPFIPILNMKSY